MSDYPYECLSDREKGFAVEHPHVGRLGLSRLLIRTGRGLLSSAGATALLAAGIVGFAGTSRTTVPTENSAELTNGAVLVELTESDDQVIGTIEVAHLTWSSGKSGVRVEHGVISGLTSGHTLTLRFGVGFGELVEALQLATDPKSVVDNSVTMKAYFRGADLVLYVPEPSGEFGEVIFSPTDEYGYKRAVDILSNPAVAICGDEPPFIRPTSIYLACADGNAEATDLHWISWGAKTAVAKGIEIWNTCRPSCVASNTTDSTTATFTLTHPVETSVGWLFETLVVQDTGHTPPGFVRREAFSEAPIHA